MASLVAGAAPAQPPLPGFGASVDVDLVDVEVKAFTARGEPVTDLRREEFRLYENGVQVPISHFFSADAARDGGGGTHPSDGEAAAADAPLHVVVLVDNAHLGASHRTLALRYVAHFVDTLPPAARVLLASYDGALNLRVGFAAPRAHLLEVLDDETWSMTTGMRAEQELRSALEAIRWRQQKAMETPFDLPCTRELLALARSYAEPKRAEVRHAIDSLGLLVDALAGLPGRKLLLLVSDGFPLRAGAEVFGYVGMLCDGSGARQGIQWAVEATALDQVQGGEAALAAAGFDASGDLAAVTGRANSAEVTLYTLQATGLQVLGAADASQAHRLVTPELDAARRANHQDPLAALALDTGGRALLERNDYLTALGGIAQDLAHFYSLGFTPTARRAGRVSTVRVEVDRPGVRLRYRTRFQFRTRDEEAAAQARAALLLDVVDNPLALALSADRGDTGQEPTGGGWRLRLTIPTAGLTCLDEAGSRSCLITVFVGAQRRDGRLTDVRSRAIPVALPAASDAGRPAANYVYEVAMPAKTPLHRIVAVVRDEMSGLLSTAITTVGAPSGAQRERSE